MTAARSRAARGLFLVAAAISAGGAGGCISAPPIVLVDRATALEQQAGGSFAELEAKLLRSGAAPRPVPLTPAQLEALGIRPAPLVDNTELTDADRVDLLLRQRCIGEATDGTLVETAAACRTSVERGEARALMDRVNGARAELWRWMHERRPQSRLEEVRRLWHAAHARGVVCGGWLQRDDGAWEPKKC